MSTDAAAAQLALGLQSWAAPTDGQGQLRREYLAFLDERGGAALRRGAGAAHVTASCFVFSPDLRETLLCFHRKGQFWVQTGGHLEPADSSVSAAAGREAREESGLDGLALVPDLLDLDRHELGGGFGACRTHWDVGFAALATTAELPEEREERRLTGPELDG